MIGLVLEDFLLVSPMFTWRRDATVEMLIRLSALPYSYTDGAQMQCDGILEVFGSA